MKISSLIVFILLVLTGCAKNHMYTSDGTCLTCWNNPITGKPINHDGKGSQEQKTDLANEANQAGDKTKITSGNNTPTEHQVSFSVPVNVDIAFLKIKEEFNYFSEQEIRQEWGSMASAKIQTFAYAYDATPSVYYHMRADRRHNDEQIIIDSKIEKQTERKSKVTITYWLRNTKSNATTIGQSLKKRTRVALNL